MIARSKWPDRSASGMELADFNQIRRNIGRVPVSYRTFPFRWAFRPCFAAAAIANAIATLASIP
jgi:hypothetical protein